MKKIVLISGGIILLGALGLGGAYFVHKSKNKKPQPPTLAQLAKLQYSVPKLTTNTDDGHLVEVALTIQAGDKTTLKDLTSASNQVNDIVNTVIHADSGDTFLSNKGIETFKSQVLQKVKALLPSKDKVSSVDVDSLIEQ